MIVSGMKQSTEEGAGGENDRTRIDEFTSI
jgi:hypothetical protein